MSQPAMHFRSKLNPQRPCYCPYFSNRCLNVFMAVTKYAAVIDRDSGNFFDPQFTPVS